MAPEEWPIAVPPSEGGARPPHSAGRGRLPTVRSDFFLDPAERLSEQERALMTAMLADLLGSIAGEIRAALPGGLAVANDGDGQMLVRQLAAAGLLDQPELMELLLRRADDERIGGAVRARSGQSSTFLQALIADSDDDVSASSMALILARGRRRDRLNQPRLEFDDLPPPLACRISYAVAASVHASLPPGEPGGEANRHIAAAAGGLLDRHDQAKQIEALTGQLVAALARASKLDEGLIGAAAEEGDIGFLAEALASRAAVPSDIAWNHLLEGGRGRFVLLLRMAAVSRDLAARLLAGLGDLVGISDPARAIAEFEQMEESRVDSARLWLTLPPSYRIAVDALGGGRG